MLLQELRSAEVLALIAMTRALRSTASCPCKAINFASCRCAERATTRTLPAPERPIPAPPRSSSQSKPRAHAHTVADYVPYSATIVSHRVQLANPHRFRHTFASDMIRAGMSLPALMQLMVTLISKLRCSTCITPQTSTFSTHVPCTAHPPPSVPPHNRAHALHCNILCSSSPRRRFPQHCTQPRNHSHHRTARNFLPISR